MKKILILSTMCICILCACQNETTKKVSPMNEESKNNKESNEEGTGSSIFKEFKDKINELEQEDGLSESMKKMTTKDGKNIFDDVIKEVEAKDAESGGQLGEMMEKILQQANKELDVDVAEVFKDGLEKINTESKELEKGFKGLMSHIDSTGSKDKIKKVMEGIDDFIKTGGENGGMEKIMEVLVEVETEENPENVNSEWMKKLKEIINNDEKSFQKETENLMREIIEKNQHLIDKYK